MLVSTGSKVAVLEPVRRRRRDHDPPSHRRGNHRTPPTTDGGYERARPIQARRRGSARYRCSVRQRAAESPDRYPLEEWDDVMDVTLDGVFYAVREAAAAVDEGGPSDPVMCYGVPRHLDTILRYSHRTYARRISLR